MILIPIDINSEKGLPEKEGDYLVEYKDRKIGAKYFKFFDPQSKIDNIAWLKRIKTWYKEISEEEYEREFNILFNEIGEWSKKTFQDANSIDHLQKLKIEAQEAKETPYRKEEYADCMIVLFAAAYKADISFYELIEAVKNKFEINKKRKWEKLSDGTYQHI